MLSMRRHTCESIALPLVVPFSDIKVELIACVTRLGVHSRQRSGVPIQRILAEIRLRMSCVSVCTCTGTKVQTLTQLYWYKSTDADAAIRLRMSCVSVCTFVPVKQVKQVN
jgi:hypothetical protein